MNKTERAAWMGYDTPEEMDAEHDELHRWLCYLFDIPSYSMIIAEGGNLPHEEYCIANYEEDAVLHVQRWLQRYRKLKQNNG